MSPISTTHARRQRPSNTASAGAGSLASPRGVGSPARSGGQGGGGTSDVSSPVRVGGCAATATAREHYRSVHLTLASVIVPGSFGGLEGRQREGCSFCWTFVVSFFLTVFLWDLFLARFGREIKF